MKLVVAATLLLAPASAMAQHRADGAQETTTSSAPEKKICRQEVATGSIMGKRVCHTKAEWSAIEESNGNAARRAMQMRGSGTQDSPR